MPAKAAGVEEEIRALYHGPLAAFIADRGALAKRLRQAGDGRESAVRALRKPSLSAWAVNQLFAGEAKAMAALVAAGERARATQQRVTAGGDAKPLREAIATIRAETTRLAARAVALLAAADRPPGEAIVERLRTDLEALALDPATAQVAARRWLDDDLEAPGFELMAALQVAAAGTRPATPVLSPARPSKETATRGTATVHRLDDRRSAVAERQQREAEDRRQRERQAEIERLAAALARSEEAAAAAQREAERAAKLAEHTAREAAAAEGRAVEA
ncbi:MAG TPA: hypothetical protein VGV61_00200, partial [Thermoanaerobaculia bacterium]|nr:hypothetical protein [Thermoanaerobaculia bacterium]